MYNINSCNNANKMINDQENHVIFLNYSQNIKTHNQDIKLRSAGNLFLFPMTFKEANENIYDDYGLNNA